MIRLILLVVIAYFIYLRFGWPGVAGAIVAYIILILIINALNASKTRQKANQLVSQKLSDDEKTHLSAVREHQEAMEDHRAQFDPELRKSRGQQQ